MKKFLTTGIAALALFVGAAVVCYAESEEKIALEKVPAAVRATIEKQAEGGKIGEIEVVKEDDKTTYEAKIEKDGKTTELKISDSGKVLGKEDANDEKDEADEKAEAKGEKAEKADADDEEDEVAEKAEAKHQKVEKADADDEEDEVAEKAGEQKEKKEKAEAQTALGKAPAEVQATAKKLLAEGKLGGFALEKDGNYELEYRIKHVDHSARIAANGKVIELEKTVKHSELPQAVKDAVHKLYPNGKIAKAEMSTVDGHSEYELKIVVGVTVSSEGKIQEEAPEKSVESKGK